MSHSEREISGSHVASPCGPPGSFLGPPSGAKVGQKKPYLPQSLSSFPTKWPRLPHRPWAGLQVYLGPKGHPLGEGPGLRAKGEPRLLGFIPD